MSRVQVYATLVVVLTLAIVVPCNAQQAAAASSATSSAATSAGSSNVNNQTVVLKVGDASFTKGQFDILYEDFRKANGSAPMRSIKEIGENYAGALMLSQQAVAHGMDKDPEIERQIEAARIQILSTAYYDKLEEKAKPTAAEIDAYYKAHLSDFDEVDIRRLFVYKLGPNSNGHGLPEAEAKAKADQIRKVLASGGDAKALIAGTQDMLDAEPLTFRRGELPGTMAQAFDMKVGEWSQVADTPDALLFFTVVRNGRLTLAQATPIVEKRLEAMKLREEMEALKVKTGVWMDEGYFSAAKGESPSPSSEKQTEEKR